MLDNSLRAAIQACYSQYLAQLKRTARYGQKVMIGTIARTLAGVKLNGEGLRQSGGHVCVVEAGTGTGKTVAYLLAAIPVAKARKKGGYFHRNGSSARTNCV